MNKIDRDSCSSSGVTFGECNVRCLLFADDFALLSSKKVISNMHLRSRFPDACLDVGMKISTAKTEIMCMSRHHVQCSFQRNGVTLQQKEKFKYLGITFLNDGRQDNELDTRIGRASAVMHQLCRSVVLKRELCTSAKLSVFRPVFVPIPTYGHECWVMTERVGSRIQADEMDFLQKVRDLYLFE